MNQSQQFTSATFTMPAFIIYKKKHLAGFTLAEMAIVVLLIGILMTAGVGMLSSQLENSANTTTVKRQDTIRAALVAYLGKNRRLPCPDNPAPPGLNVAFDGIEDRTGVAAGPTPNVTTACINPFGTVPYVTLGLSRETALDGWNNFLGYHVSNTPYNWTLTASFNAGSQGGLTINRRTPAGALIAPPVNTPAVAVIVSYGKNGSGAYAIKGTRNTLPTAADELDNTNGNIIYYQREYTDSPGAGGGPFDDMVSVLQIGDLISPALQTKSLRSFEEETAIATRDIEDIKSALTGFTMRNFRLPYADNTGDGLEDVGVYTGDLPWRTLGVAANDPWTTVGILVPATATPYRYRVTPYLTNVTAAVAPTTPVTIPVGTDRNFVVQTNLQIVPNMIIRMEDPGNVANYIQGTVLTYVGTNLRLTSISTGGAGLIANSRSSFKHLIGFPVGTGGNLNVRNNVGGAILITDAPFVVFSRGRNDVAYFTTVGNVGAPCAGAAPIAPNPPRAPNCLGTGENANLNTAIGTAALPYIKAPLTVPPFVAPTAPDPRSGFDDILDYVSKSVIDVKLP